ncbi:hypothetical protein OEZ86_001298 [Tetradesmus obliquus]|nr:hypothetical protein OEZ86_001298 [Tetradesmus obliquus]
MYAGQCVILIKIAFIAWSAFYWTTPNSSVVAYTSGHFLLSRVTLSLAVARPGIVPVQQQLEQDSSS